MMFCSEDEKRTSKCGTDSSVDSGLDIPDRRQRQPRRRGMTECEEDSDQHDMRKQLQDRVSRPSSVTAEMKLKQSGELLESAESILGCVHLDLAVYHENCRFDANIQDERSAHFHLKAAADCEDEGALIAISNIYLGLPNDILPALTHYDVEEYVEGNMVDAGLDYMTTVARKGDVHSMMFLARAFDSGQNLGTARQQSYQEAMLWYERAVEEGVEKRYLIIARMAEILLMDDPGLRDPNRAGELYSEAAEAAMEEMCGKLATKYYTLSEEAWSLVEE